MEFLYTYGWAFMVVLIALGVLGYMVFSETFISDTCYISDSLSCSDYAVNDGVLSIKIQNGVGVQIELINFECKYETHEVNVDLNQYFTELGEDAYVTSGGFKEFSCAGLILKENRKNKITFVIEYLESGKTFNSYVNGYVVANNRVP